MLNNKHILLIISGGIAAYKVPDLIRQLRSSGASVRCVMTKSAEQFITPLTVSALSEDKVYQDLFDLKDESEMGHIRLSREADVVLVAPATANILAKLTHGICDDLASTLLLATDKEVIVAPAMNVEMWHHEATQSNIKTLKQRGVLMVGPNAGELACGEVGFGRMAEPTEIVSFLQNYFSTDKKLSGLKALVTSGPTYEPIDPVRYIANRSSGKQGHAIAQALANYGADVTLVSGPTCLPDPVGVKVIRIETAQQMLQACQTSLPADIFVAAAAVADWTVKNATDSKMKKDKSGQPPALQLTENPDILQTISQLPRQRPQLVIGFAAETDDVINYAKSKRLKKGCDWILANDVSPQTGTFGGDENTVHFVTESGVSSWPKMSKQDVSTKLVEEISKEFESMKVTKIA